MVVFDSTSAMQTILPGIERWCTRLKVKHHPVNSYVYRDVLIDPAADIPSDLAVSHILVTHVQEEHIAGAANFPDVLLHVPAGDEYLCQGQEAYEQLITPWEYPWNWDNRGNFQGHLAGARNERPTLEPLPIANSLREGETHSGLKIIATPGHGKHAVSLLTEVLGRRIAFCGDLICGDGQLWNWFDCDWDYGLQTGQKTLLASARKLLREKPDILLPSHGEPIYEAQLALRNLITRLERVISDEDEHPPLNFPDNDEPGAGWRQLSPHLYQWKSGNCALLTSEEGVGLLVDDGLCHWVALEEQASHHRAVMAEIKAKLGLLRIEVVVITHYHGDHIYNIPMLLQEEPEVRIMTLECIDSLVEDSRQSNLAAPLWWYGVEYDTVPVHRVLSDGEKFRWHEYELEIFHLGGQTYYHCGLNARIDGQRVLFVGDAIYGWKSECEPILTYNDAEPTSGGWLYATERMLERRPDLLVCGHGSAIREPLPLLQMKKAAWQQRMANFDTLNPRANRQAFFSPFAA